MAGITIGTSLPATAVIGALAASKFFFNSILIITIKKIVEEIDKIKDKPTTQRHTPTV